MNRRIFLLSASSAFMSQGLTGCRLQKHQALRLQVLQSSISPQTIKSFRQRQSVDLDVALTSDPRQLYKLLQAWGKDQPTSGGSWRLPLLGWGQPSKPAHLLSLGDYWLSSAIAQNLLRPLSVDALKNWKLLPNPWQRVVQRDSQGHWSQAGSVWGLPYRWGATVIVYRRDVFKTLGWQPTDWSDLWRPELQGHISLLDQPREVIGLTLKMLGQSYNPSTLDASTELTQKLTALNRQTRFYSSTTYLQPLILGDTWLAVGWSSDVILAMQQHPELELIVPRSGTALWADLWVQPRLAPTSDLIQDWVDFCLQPDVMQQIARFNQGGSWGDKTPLNPLLGESALWIDPATRDRSEFLQPLGMTLARQYEDLWQRMRQSPLA